MSWLPYDEGLIDQITAAMDLRLPNATALANPDVLAKKTAALDWVDRVNESQLFGTWRYLLVGETDIAKSPNWAALTARA